MLPFCVLLAKLLHQATTRSPFYFGDVRVIRAASIQTVEDIYRMIWTAVENKRPVVARLQRTPPGCFVRTGSARPAARTVSFALCDTSTVEKARVVWNRSDHPRIGAVLCWKRSREMDRAKPTWGEERIFDELSVELGIQVSPRTVRKYLEAPPPSVRPTPLVGGHGFAALLFQRLVNLDVSLQHIGHKLR